ncbi:hypothetical protein P4O66_011925, partial [Electrophorus voltai]
CTIALSISGCLFLCVSVHLYRLPKPDGRLDGRAEAAGDCRQRLLEFAFDYCYWSVNPEAPNYASQEEVFQDLGVSVLAGAAEGYNVCLFAYGQTGSGKTYTMMGTPGLFRSHIDSPDGQNCRVEISFSEIYNERVRDLLRGTNQKKPPSLRVREHPEKGPYVQGLSQHVVSDYKQAVDLLEEGIANRITAATHVHDASSRSHAIFSIQYTQAILENNLPSEIVSKINLVDLAGSERADPQYCRDRITEGANINKSLVTLGIVISALAQNSQMCSSSQSINSVLSEGEGSQSSSLSGIGRRLCFIPYRDSVLTWLLKDSLGGNSKTIMIATVSPSCSSYNETLGTLRYAAHARNIVNKPRVNEDANVRLIRDLREEIDRLKSMLLSFSMQRNPSPSLSDERDSSLSDMVLQNELKVRRDPSSSGFDTISRVFLLGSTFTVLWTQWRDLFPPQVEQLTKDWSEGWRDKRALLEHYSVDINKDRAGVQIRSLLPHLIALEPDVLTTGVTIYHLREGVTRIGPEGENEEGPHIVLPEGSACEIENQNGIVTLRPLPHSVCMVNSRDVTEPCRLAQGAVITLGGLRKFRFNHPAEAAVLRERRRTSEGGLLCSSSVQDELTLCLRECLQIRMCSLHVPCVCFFVLRTAAAGSQELGDGPPPRQWLEEQQRYVECLREEIQVEQRRAERDLEREQAHLRQQRAEILQWILEEKQHLSVVRERGTLESGMQTDLIPLPALAGVNKDSLEEGDPEMVNPLMIVVGVRKRVVQEELLKHHALRRAENRIRRKRLQYQLERIARKRHLLEAKRELQRLENAFAVDGLSSPELASPKCRGGLVLRRHSFSADLLSRLYTHQTPIFRSVLDKKHRRWHSAEALTNNTGKWLKKQEELTEWVDNSKDDSSDCDSLFSVDSLSSAYTKALAEQLKQENCEPSEAESEDSQMSKDSLVMDISGKLGTAGPVPKAVQSSCCSFQSSFNLHQGDSSMRESYPLEIDIANPRVGVTIDIGIQTEDTSMLMKQSKVVNQSPAVENAKAHEVNVTVRVIVKHGQPENCSQSQLKSSTPFNQSYKNSMLEYNRRFSDGMGKCWNDMSKRILQHQEEDAVSLSPSECNTDVLVNVDPLTDTSPIKEDQQLPEDLPIHNKFNNWSGINQPPPAGLTNKSNPTVAKNSGVNTQNLHTSLAESERTGSGPKPEFLEVTDKRTREIERLRKDREQVMASVRLDLSSPQLSVELKEAKLHYGLGETDTMLKLLKSSPREEPVISTNQQLYERHRRSIDGLRKEREARLQTCRRARSLSPSKHPNSSAQRPSHLPSRRREYLQQLRQEVVQTSRVPDPQRRGGQYPPDIELLLRDYSRAREEARTEIARARERLRERTEQEKRRLQQQALAQAVKDDIKIRTRVSNSTLCTGSNLSLSSGPTSGYNSSNAALLKDSGSPSLQIPGISDAGFRVKNQPSVIPFQNSKAPRVWLSAQDVRLETPPSGLELQSCSSPSTPPARQRTFSFGWPSSVSTSYQDIADCTLDSALSEVALFFCFIFLNMSNFRNELSDAGGSAQCLILIAVAQVRLASGGDLRNLLEGKATAGWRHQGMERGVQTFHRPSSRPSAHGFLGAMELDRPLASVWNLIRDHSKTHLFHESLRSAWTRSLDDSTQLVYLLTDPANCHLKQPRDFCCLSTESKQNDMWVLAMQSVFEESLPRPSADTIRAEMLPSAWVLQPSQCRDRIVLIVTYLLQVDLGTPSLPKRFLNVVARSQAAVIADLESFLSS